MIIRAFIDAGNGNSDVNYTPNILRSLFDPFGSFRDDVVTAPCHVSSEIINSDWRTKNDDNQWILQSYELLYQKSLRMPNILVIGGDQTVSQPSIFASLVKQEHPENLYVIWIDRNPDIHLYKNNIRHNRTTVSGIIGLDQPWVKCDKRLSTNNLLYFGFDNCPDDYENNAVKKLNIFHTKELSILLFKVNEIIKNNLNAVFHVSFDVNSLERKYFNSVGNADAEMNLGSLSPDDVCELLKHLKQRIVGFDLVECDTEKGEKIKSFNTLKHIFTAFI